MDTHDRSHSEAILHKKEKKMASMKWLAYKGSIGISQSQSSLIFSRLTALSIKEARNFFEVFQVLQLTFLRAGPISALLTLSWSKSSVSYRQLGLVGCGHEWKVALMLTKVLIRTMTTSYKTSSIYTYPYGCLIRKRIDFFHVVGILDVININVH